MRVLLAWELGLNCGHLARLLPIAERLRINGHTVLVAVRRVDSAASVFRPKGIRFLQAPHLPIGIPLKGRAAGYADILLSQGWSNREALWGLVQSWLAIFELFRPDRVVLDYSPTANLAAVVADLPVIFVGNGFEIPPLVEPLPAFPGFSWATPQATARAEETCIDNSRAVLKSFGCTPIESLRIMLARGPRLVASIPALDHYGARNDVCYIGPIIGGISSKFVAWPAGNGIKVFACVRPDSNQADAILEALGTIDARVVCVAQGLAANRLAPIRRAGVIHSEALVDLQPLLNADVGVTYGAEGTMLRFTAAGVPQLISPRYVEAYLSARRFLAAGCALQVSEAETAQGVVSLIQRLCGSSFKLHSRVLAETTSSLLREVPADVVVRVVSVPHDSSIFSPRSPSGAMGYVRKEHIECSRC